MAEDGSKPLARVAPHPFLHVVLALKKWLAKNTADKRYRLTPRGVRHKPTLAMVGSTVFDGDLDLRDVPRSISFQKLIDNIKVDHARTQG